MSPVSGSSPGSGIYANVSSITKMSPSSTFSTKPDEQNEGLSENEIEEACANDSPSFVNISSSSKMSCPSQNQFEPERIPAQAEAEECYFSSSSSSESNIMEEAGNLDLTHDISELEAESLEREAQPRTFNQIKQKIQSRGTKIKPDDYVGFSKLPYQVYRCIKG